MIGTFARFLSPIRQALALAAVVLATSPLRAQDTSSQQNWPTATVKIIVPYLAGATADGLPRILAEDLSQIWKQPVVLENRAGAGGNVGAEYAARSPPDGLTLLHAPTPVYAINQFVYKKLGFDPEALKPVITVAASPSVLAVSLKTGVANVAELIAKAKTEPGQISYASQGNGSTSHITAALFEYQAGVKLAHVPYRGSAPAMNDMVGGHVGVLFDNLFSSLTQHKAGTIRIIAACTPERLASIPEIPTMIEAGLSGFVSIAYFGFTAPPGTPDKIVEKISADIATVLAKPEIRARIQGLGATVVGGTPADMTRLLASERIKWSAAIRNANIPQVE